MIASEYAGPSGSNSSPRINILSAGSELGLAENDVDDGVVTESDVVEALLVANAFCAKTLY